MYKKREELTRTGAMLCCQRPCRASSCCRCVSATAHYQSPACPPCWLDQFSSLCQCGPCVSAGVDGLDTRGCRWARRRHQGPHRGRRRRGGQGQREPPPPPLLPLSSLLTSQHNPKLAVTFQRPPPDPLRVEHASSIPPASVRCAECVAPMLCVFHVSPSQVPSASARLPSLQFPPLPCPLAPPRTPALPPAPPTLPPPSRLPAQL
jgi:hypothetical protein